MTLALEFHLVTNIAALALANDQVLLANNQPDTQSLIDSAVHLSAQNNYQYVPSKTKILVTNPKPSKSSAPSIPANATWTVGGASVPISSQATHLGIVRSGHHTSNSPAVVTRIAAHARALFRLLNLGLAKGHMTPPATSLRIEAIFAAPVLFSRLAPLLLTKPEVSTLNVYTRKILWSILKLHDKTAGPAIYLLSGVLPAEATVHIRQFSLLWMVAYLGPSNPLYQLAVQNLTKKVSSSWFAALRKTASMYGLPDPLHILLVPPNKGLYKKMVCDSITLYWTQRISTKASTMTSLKLMRPLSIPLGSRPHPIFSTCSSPHQFHIACIQAKMLVGTYRSCFHVRHWQHSTGACKLPDCGQYPGDLLHIFKSCPFL